MERNQPIEVWEGVLRLLVNSSAGLAGCQGRVANCTQAIPRVGVYGLAGASRPRRREWYIHAPHFTLLVDPWHEDWQRHLMSHSGHRRYPLGLRRSDRASAERRDASEAHRRWCDAHFACEKGPWSPITWMTILTSPYSPALHLKFCPHLPIDQRFQQHSPPDLLYPSCFLNHNTHNTRAFNCSLCLPSSSISIVLNTIDMFHGLILHFNHNISQKLYKYCTKVTQGNTTILQ